MRGFPGAVLLPCIIVRIVRSLLDAFVGLWCSTLDKVLELTDAFNKLRLGRGERFRQRSSWSL